MRLICAVVVGLTLVTGSIPVVGQEAPADDSADEHAPEPPPKQLVARAKPPKASERKRARAIEACSRMT